MKLFSCTPSFYRVKKGQNLQSVAAFFHLPPRYLALCNGLTGEPQEGQVLSIPKAKGNLYTVQGGESKSLLCGSREMFASQNGTGRLYIGQCVFLHG